LVALTVFNASAPTIWTFEVWLLNVRFVWKALVTTTSWIVLACCCKLALTLLEEPTVISLLAKDCDETTSTSPVFTRILKSPLASDCTPVFDPFTSTEANGIGLPLLSVTLPVTTRLCANAKTLHSISIVNSDRILLMCA
ncbi:MAG: hypothetical protein ABIO05_00830, partial [Ferruginibacter sp.]